MSSRLPSRLTVFSHAALNSLRQRQAPSQPQRILIAHHLLLGDTLMLTPLLAKLRQQYPRAQIIMTTPKAIAPLYQHHPYGVEALPYDPRDRETLVGLLQQDGFDLAIVPGDNRYSWLARALDARWIIAFAGDRPAYKSWPVDQLIDYPAQPAHWGDMVAGLIDGPPPPPYDPNQWPAPDCREFQQPDSPYCILHVGASTPLKLWPNNHWQQLAQQLNERGYQVVWSGGRNEQDIVDAIDSAQRYPSYAGQLDLAQLWQLFAKASLVVCPDTGVAHLGRLVGTPTITLFGPGSPPLHGAGRFWENSPYIAITNDIPCRDQRLLFKRELAWVRRCGRNPAECPEAKCMQGITVEQVWQAAETLLPDNQA